MIGLGLLALIVILVAAYGLTRFRSFPGDAGDATHATVPAEVRATGLARWVAAGLITADQADAITAYEQAQAVARPKPRVSPAIEALAYLGGILLAVGAGMLVGQFWGSLGVGGRIGALAVAAALTGTVGAVVGETEPVTWRLRGFLWALSTAAIAATAGLFAFETLDARGEPVALAAAGVGGLSAFAYWWLRNRPLQHVLTFAGLAVSVGVGILWAEGSGAHGLLIGLALWVVGAGWAWLGWQGRVPPAAVGFLVGIVLTLIASGIAGSQVRWVAPLLGLATAAVWVTAGVVGAERLALAPGIVGVFVFLPWTLGYFFGETVGAPVVAMLSGALLLVIVLALVRRGRGRDGNDGRARGGHFRALAHP